MQTQIHHLSMTVKFDYFLSKFPVVELPVILSEDSHHDFSNENDPLSPAVIDKFMTQYETTVQDDMTEYVACFQLPLENKSFSAIIYWKAGLLNYDYILATYDTKTGTMIDKKAIAGTKVVGNAVKRIVAIVKEDLTVHSAEGIEEGGQDYDADSTKVKKFAILDNGRIEQDY